MKQQKLLSLIRQAIQDYNMIEDGDRIAVGVSGGKDSLTNFPALQYGIHFLYQILSRSSFVHKLAFHSIPDYPERLL